MSADTPADPPPWQQGPPPGYHPPPAEALTDPATHDRAHQTGRAACIAAIEAATGKTKTERGWIARDESNDDRGEKR